MHIPRIWFLAPWLLIPLCLHGQPLQVYTWADIMDFSVIEDFESRHGLRVEYHTYRQREALEARLAEGLGSLDLVMLPDDLLAQLAQQGALQTLDSSALDNWRHLHPGLLDAMTVLDPHPYHGVGYFWGVSGLLMDVAAIRQRLPGVPLDSLALLLEPSQFAALADCGVWLPDSASEVIPMVLGFLGEPRNSASARALDRVDQQLQRLGPHLAGIHSLAGLEQLARGDACLSLAWSDSAARTREINPGLDFRIPREGARLWLDLLAIPVDAPQPQAALALLNYLLDPVVHAQVANYAYLAPTNRSSWPLLLPEIRDDPAILPPEPPGGFYTVGPDPATRAAWEALWEKSASTFRQGLQ